MSVLAIDLGGTKILAALVDGAGVTARAAAETDRAGGPGRWLAQIGELVRDWSGQWTAAGLCATGRILAGSWSALNPGTLPLDAPFPLAAAASRLLGRPVRLANDAQAAAWGEFRHGAGAGRDMVFLTVSTGIGGGLVLGGRLVEGQRGIAMSAGQMVPLDGDAVRIENLASGRFIAEAAGDTRAAVAAGHPAVAVSAGRVARLCRNLHLAVDPAVIVMGGGVGLGPGYLDRVRDALAEVSDPFAPEVIPAALGDAAGVIGIADLADRDDTTGRGPNT